MRLIDADKLRAEYKDPEDIRDSAKVLYHVTGIWAEIDAADTVEAIPVDWIEEKMKNLVSPGCKDVLDWLLAEWREEQNNGIDKS